jgi:hypothetical protein
MKLRNANDNSKVRNFLQWLWKITEFTIIILYSTNILAR